MSGLEVFNDSSLIESVSCMQRNSIMEMALKKLNVLIYFLYPVLHCKQTLCEQSTCFLSRALHIIAIGTSAADIGADE